MNRNLYQNAAILLMISGALHIVALILTGGLNLIFMLGAAAFWAVVGWALIGERRWLAHVAFLVALAGGCLTLGLAMTTAPPGSWALWGILAADWLAAFTLFRLLWRPRAAA